MNRDFAVLGVLILTVVAAGCLDHVETSVGLDIQDHTFAVVDEDTGELSPVDRSEFEQGEEVALVLQGVSGFEANEEGLYNFNIDMEITDGDDEVIIEEEEMIQEEDLELENGVARSPYATVSTDDFEEGSYNFGIDIYDEESDGRASLTASFTIE